MKGHAASRLPGQDKGKENLRLKVRKKAGNSCRRERIFWPIQWPASRKAHHLSTACNQALIQVQMLFDRVRRSALDGKVLATTPSIAPRLHLPVAGGSPTSGAPVRRPTRVAPRTIGGTTPTHTAARNSPGPHREHMPLPVLDFRRSGSCARRRAPARRMAHPETCGRA
jgi:hypothetical protein